MLGICRQGLGCWSRNNSGIFSIDGVNRSHSNNLIRYWVQLDPISGFLGWKTQYTNYTVVTMVLEWFSILYLTIRGLRRTNPRKKKMVSLLYSHTHTLLLHNSHLLFLAEPASIPTKCISQKQTVPIRYQYSGLCSWLCYCIPCPLCVQVFIVVYWFWGAVWRRLYQENTLHRQTKATGPFINVHFYITMYV